MKDEGARGPGCLGQIAILLVIVYFLFGEEPARNLALFIGGGAAVVGGFAVFLIIAAIIGALIGLVGGAAAFAVLPNARNFFEIHGPGSIGGSWISVLALAGIAGIVEETGGSTDAHMFSDQFVLAIALLGGALGAVGAHVWDELSG